MYLKNRSVGPLAQVSRDAISFSYRENWMGWEYGLLASLLLPLRETHYPGELFAGVFEKLLSASEHLRRLKAEKVGAR